MQPSKPRAGDRITYKGQPAGVIIRVEGNLCWVAYDGAAEAMPFIWRFKDGSLNTLHEWPGKS